LYYNYNKEESMQSIYTAGMSSYSMANLYQPAGIVNVNSSYYNNNTNPNYMSQQRLDNSGGVLYAAPTIKNTSSAMGLSVNGAQSVETLTDNNFSAQHNDYQKNPAAISCTSGGSFSQQQSGTGNTFQPVLPGTLYNLNNQQYATITNNNNSNIVLLAPVISNVSAIKTGNPTPGNNIDISFTSNIATLNPVSISISINSNPSFNQTLTSGSFFVSNNNTYIFSIDHFFTPGTYTVTITGTDPNGGLIGINTGSLTIS
jgi:hypothetical protein